MACKALQARSWSISAIARHLEINWRTRMGSLPRSSTPGCAWPTTHTCGPRPCMTSWLSSGNVDNLSGHQTGQVKLRYVPSCAQFICGFAA